MQVKDADEAYRALKTVNGSPQTPETNCRSISATDHGCGAARHLNMSTRQSTLRMYSSFSPNRNDVLHVALSTTLLLTLFVYNSAQPYKTTNSLI